MPSFNLIFKKIYKSIRYGADPGQTLAELFPLIDQHIKIQDVACNKMPINTEKMLRQLEQIQGDIAQFSLYD